MCNQSIPLIPVMTTFPSSQIPFSARKPSVAFSFAWPFLHRVHGTVCQVPKVPFSFRTAATNQPNMGSSRRRERDPASLIKIIISTDNHLGYLEKDPLRGEDSFRAFEEVLQLAKANAADMVLLGGDLFHDNKPSRRTIVRTMQILRRMCLGYDEVRLAVRSDISNVNYMNENYAVSLPVFIIHGNHDDPTGATGLEALSALDLLAEANLVTYFGKVETAKKIDVAPILLQKGATKIALYGLGNVRDEVLFDTWSRQRKVRWLSPDEGQVPGDSPNQSAENGDADEDEEDEDDDDEPGFVRKSSEARKNASRWFNLFVLHQNRLTRGSSRGITETLLPPWLDYVVWGHEHDSIPDLKLSKPPIVQPGSSVATSLSPGESRQKHAILLEVYKGTIQHRPIPLRLVRNFEIDDVVLSDHEELNHLKPETLKEFLDERVNQMIERQEALHDVARAALEDGSAPLTGDGFKFADHDFYLKHLTQTTRQPLIRLRVELSGGWESINVQRFGQQFIGRCASSSDIILFYRQRQVKTTKKFLSGHADGSNRAMTGADGEEMDAEEYAEELRKDIEGGARDTDAENACKIPKLVQYYLYHKKAGGTGLQFLELDKLSSAVHEFVEKAEVQAIPHYVQTFLKEQQAKTLRNKEHDGEEEWNEEKIIESFKTRAKEAASRVLLDDQGNKEDGGEDGDDGDDEMRDVADKENEALKKSTEERIQEQLESQHNVISQDPKLRRIIAATAAAAAARGNEDSDEEEHTTKTTKSRSRAKTTTRKKSTAGTTRGRGGATARGRKKKAAVVEDSEDSEDDIMDANDRAAAAEAAKKPPRRATRGRGKPAAAVIDVDLDAIEEVDDEEEEYVAPARNSRKRKASTSAAGSSSRSRARGRKESQSPAPPSSSFGSRARNRRATPTIDLDGDSVDDAM